MQRSVTASLLHVTFLQVPDRPGRLCLSVCDVATHEGRDTEDDPGKLRVAPEASGLGSRTSRILPLLAGGSHVAHADANEAGTGRSHTYRQVGMCVVCRTKCNGAWGQAPACVSHNRLTHAGCALPFPGARSLQRERKLETMTRHLMDQCWLWEQQPTKGFLIINEQ